MKIRIIRNSFYYGQRYDEKNKCWRDITHSRPTKRGVKKTIKKWLWNWAESQISEKGDGYSEISD